MLTVTLSHIDIANLAHEMNKDWFTDSPPPSQGALEWLICSKLKKNMGIDFFLEQRNQQMEDDKHNFSI